MKKFPYERVMAWLAGPISIVSGWGATLVLKYVPLGFGKDETAKAVVYGVTFVVGTGVTWMTHQKWFTGLWKWWDHETADAAVVAAKTISTQEKETVT